MWSRRSLKSIWEIGRIDMNLNSQKMRRCLSTLIADWQSRWSLLNRYNISIAWQRFCSRKINAACFQLQSWKMCTTEQPCAAFNSLWGNSIIMHVDCSPPPMPTIVHCTPHVTSDHINICSWLWRYRYHGWKVNCLTTGGPFLWKNLS